MFRWARQIAFSLSIFSTGCKKCSKSGFHATRANRQISSIRNMRKSLTTLFLISVLVTLTCFSVQANVPSVQGQDSRQAQTKEKLPSLKKKQKKEKESRGKPTGSFSVEVVSQDPEVEDVVKVDT